MSSLSQRMQHTLNIIRCATNDNGLYQYATNLQSNIGSISTNDLYHCQNRRIVQRLLNFFKYRNDWETTFICDYDSYQKLFVTLPVSSVYQLFAMCDEISIELHSIYTSNDEQMQIEKEMLRKKLTEYIDTYPHWKHLSVHI